MSDLFGFLLIDKEQGWTSHDVVAKVRRHAGGKVGHAGTLDPMATGLLVLGMGKATRLLRFVQGARKQYLATAQFGVATDSLDADGAVLSRDPMPVDEESTRAAMERFEGDILQVPPMVSARKVEGKRLYELAREGKVVEREARPVTIDSLELVDFAPSDYPEVTFRVECSTGTYVRTLADDIARALGGRAHLSALRRIANGSLSVHDAHSVEEATTAFDESRGSEMLVPAVDALPPMASVRVDEATEMRVRNGRPIDALNDDVLDDDLVCVLSRGGDLIAMYRRTAGSLKPEVVLA
ncbi:MAG: tRNA pseudouridine(55) synthase TruB [Acidimicrobiia bacterium]